MTLRDKLKPTTSINTQGEAGRFADKSVKVAEEFAIGFAEWLNEEYSYYHGDGEYYDHVENKWYKLKELLEIYKNIL